MMISAMKEGTLAAEPDSAFYDLYDREAPVVLHYLRAALSDLPTAEDLCADAFCRAWRGWRRFQGDDAAARAWVMRIARNVLIDHIRRDRRVAFVPLQREHRAPGRSESATVDRLLVQQAILLLGPDDRDLLGMRIAGLSHAEIATIRGSSEEAVKKAWQRALGRVRPHLEVTA